MNYPAAELRGIQRKIILNEKSMVSHALPFMDTPMQSIEELTIKF
jgi:hypothetical protein